MSVRRPGRVAPVLLLVIVGCVLAACAGTTGPATPRPTLHLASFAPGGPQQTAPGDSTVAGSNAGASAAVGSAGPSLPSAAPKGSYPDAADSTLLGHLPAKVRATCHRSGPFYADELASVSCGDGTTVPYVDYTLFPSPDELNAAYSGDLASVTPAPTTTGTCALGTLEGPYDVGGVTTGRIWCSQRADTRGDSVPVIEWTNARFQILGVITGSGQTVDTLTQFWRSEAGPFA